MSVPMSVPVGTERTSGMPLSDPEVRRVDGRRRVVVERDEVEREEDAGEDAARAAVRRGAVVVLRLVARLVARLVEAAFLVAVRFVVDAARFVEVAARLAVVVERLAVVVARRRVDAARVLVPRAICRACLVSPSMRLRTLLTSARVLAFLT